MRMHSKAAIASVKCLFCMKTFSTFTELNEHYCPQQEEEE